MSLEKPNEITYYTDTSDSSYTDTSESSYTDTSDSSDTDTSDPYIVAIDMDETLGSFVELGIFWDALQKLTGNNSKEEFFKIIDTFPNFIRPGMLYILKFLVIKKKKFGKKLRLVIFTNNQGPKSWAQLISEYFNYKLNAQVFDTIIGAYKINGQIIENCRTSNEKKLSDLLACTNMPYNSNIIFIDDLVHEKMIDANVYYIHVKPYHYSEPYVRLATMYYNKNPIDYLNKKEFVYGITKIMKRYKYKVRPKSNDEVKLDKIVGKHMLTHLLRQF